VVGCPQAKEFALAHWLVGGADGGRLFVRCFDAVMAVRESLAGDVLASLTTMQWNSLSKAWTSGAVMADVALNRRMMVRVVDAIAFAQIGVVGFDWPIELEALRLYGLPVSQQESWQRPPETCRRWRRQREDARLPARTGPPLAACAGRVHAGRVRVGESSLAPTARWHQKPGDGASADRRPHR
jgi:hypothetical protein